MTQKATGRFYERINITLPRSTLGLLDRVTSKGNRSRFINEAIHQFAKGRSRSELRKLLEEDGRVNRDRDLAVLEEWSAVDAEAWRGPRRR
jgi:CopG family transcriptional regulator / antitoxin EndoAI